MVLLTFEVPFNKCVCKLNILVCFIHSLSKYFTFKISSLKDLTHTAVYLPSGIAVGPRCDTISAKRYTSCQPTSSRAATDDANPVERSGAKLWLVRAAAQVPAGVWQELPKPTASAITSGRPAAHGAAVALPAAPAANAAPATPTTATTTTNASDSNNHGGATTHKGVDQPGESAAHGHSHSDHPEQPGGANSGAPATGLRPGRSRRKNYVL
jgi:hypothetical protein